MRLSEELYQNLEEAFNKSLAAGEINSFYEKACNRAELDGDDDQAIRLFFDYQNDLAQAFELYVAEELGERLEEESDGAW